MTSQARRRLIRDYKKLLSEPISGISASPNEDDIMMWKAVIFGPEDTPWEGGTFLLTIEFTEQFPNQAP
jgi:ubiquitin-conjugating enzyme E2 A